MTEGLRSLAFTLPGNALFGEGPLIGLSLVMIDHSSAERNALTTGQQLHFPAHSSSCSATGHACMIQRTECT